MARGTKGKSTREIESEQLNRDPTPEELESVAGEGMDVHATAPAKSDEDLSDITSRNDPRFADDADAGDVGEDSPVNDITTRLTEALEALAAKNTGTDPVVMGILTTLTAAVDRLSQGQIDGARIIAKATKQAQRPSNEQVPAISTLNPRGEKDFPKPRLKCKMFLPWEAEEDSLDREEIELLNLLEPGDYIVIRNDRTKVKLEVRAQYKLDSDHPSVMLFHHDTAFNNDYHRMMPPMVDMLRGMLKQNPKTRSKGDLVLSMDEELALIAAGKLNDGTIPESGILVSVGE